MSSYPFKRTCKEVSALLVAGEDSELPLVERVALCVHLAMCEACPRFERQLLTMRNAMKQWRAYANDARDGE